MSRTDSSSPRPTEERPSRQRLLSKVADLLHQTIRSRESSVSGPDPPQVPNHDHDHDLADTDNTQTAPSPQPSHLDPDKAKGSTAMSPSSTLLPRVIETKHVSLEYDPITRRKVLNTYEILREIGRGEHGKVKLARDLVHDELVAIKIVSRKSKKDRLLRMRRTSHAPLGDYETKIRREIAIMKRCDHKYIVKLKEVLDDLRLYKIYLVLEYMDRGEIKWKRHTPIEVPRPHDADDERIPCCVAKHGSFSSVEDNDLLSNDYLPNLTFRQSRRIFRDVLLGLEYLHMQGIVHRDIKPANLLVSSDYVVKISDFGVSFASSLSSSDDGMHVSDMELAKTVGTPAFFAPELCQTNFSAGTSAADVASADMARTASGSSAIPTVDHKIDIWALGVTLYCLLFGKVPFNADSEFALFDVIVNQPLEFPPSRDSFHSPQVVSEEEFALAKDLLSKMLQKNSKDRYDISEIKEHPFVLMDLENDIEKLQELFFLNMPSGGGLDSRDPREKVLQDELDNAVVGVANRLRSSLMKAISSAEGDAYRKLSCRLEKTLSSSSDSSPNSHQNSSAQLLNTSRSGHSFILSEALLLLPSTDAKNSVSGSKSTLAILSPQLAHITPHHANSLNPLQSITSTLSSSSSLSSQPQQRSPTATHPRSNLVFQDVLEMGSTSSLRKDSSGGTLEAPQIETKRNVGGDLYMKNQSAIDAFKVIQHQDQRRRKSSIFASRSQASSACASPRPSRDSIHPPSTPSATPLGITAPDMESKIKVGPISIDNSRRPSSVISLPLTESFASLDSYNDDYLTSKYQEYKKKRQRFLEEGITNSDPGLVSHSTDVAHVSEKFKAFNLGSLMATERRPLYPTNPESVGPRSRTFGHSSIMNTSGSSCTSSSSCASGSGSESDEEGANLTFKFSSKVSRPNRVISHESNLPDLANQQTPNFYDVPIVFQDDLLEFEDVPENLMGGATELLIDMTPTTSMLANSQSSATITNDVHKFRLPQVAPVQSSPLRKEVVGSPVDVKTAAPVEPLQVRRKQSMTRVPPSTSFFNNHYKKELTKVGFPFAKHLDADRESYSKQLLKEAGNFEARPTYNRSNSITLGLLQHERSMNDGKL